MSKCSGCSVTLADKQKFCHECGTANSSLNTSTNTPIVKVVCSCGTPFDNESMKFCTQCGKARPPSATPIALSTNGNQSSTNGANGNHATDMTKRPSSSPIIGPTLPSSTSTMTTTSIGSVSSTTGPIGPQAPAPTGTVGRAAGLTTASTTSRPTTSSIWSGSGSSQTAPPRPKGNGSMVQRATIALNNNANGIKDNTDNSNTSLTNSGGNNGTPSALTASFSPAQSVTLRPVGKKVTISHNGPSAPAPLPPTGRVTASIAIANANAAAAAAASSATTPTHRGSNGTTSATTTTSLTSSNNGGSISGQPPSLPPAAHRRSRTTHVEEKGGNVDPTNGPSRPARSSPTHGSSPSWSSSSSASNAPVPSTTHKRSQTTATTPKTASEIIAHLQKAKEAGASTIVPREPRGPSRRAPIAMGGMGSAAAASAFASPATPSLTVVTNGNNNNTTASSPATPLGSPPSSSPLPPPLTLLSPTSTNSLSSPSTSSTSSSLGSPASTPTPSSSKNGKKEEEAEADIDEANKEELSIMINIAMEAAIANHDMSHVDWEGENTPCHKREVTDDHFRIKDRVPLKHDGTNYVLKAYSAPIFCRIRHHWGITKEEWVSYLGPGKRKLSGGPSQGKSKSFFYFAEDNRFILKTTNHSEARFLRKILPAYYKYIRTYPHTMLPRFYGLFKMELPAGRVFWFVIMNNVFDTSATINTRFDLKGSTQGRNATAQEKEKDDCILKDLDILESNRKLQLGRQNKLLVELTLTQDCKFLQDHTVMDYSFLLGVHNVNGTTGALTASSSPMSAEATMMTSGVSVKSLAGNIDTNAGGGGTVPNGTTSNGSTSSTVNGPRKPPPAAPGATTPSTPTNVNSNGANNASAVPPPLLHTGSGTKEKKRSLMRADDLKGDGPLPKPGKKGNHRVSIFQRDLGGLLSADGQEIYYLGIIDILQPYNARKRLETGFKGLVYDVNTISAVDPATYATRFLHFMENIFE